MMQPTEELRVTLPVSEEEKAELSGALAMHARLGRDAWYPMVERLRHAIAKPGTPGTLSLTVLEAGFALGCLCLKGEAWGLPPLVERILAAYNEQIAGCV